MFTVVFDLDGTVADTSADLAEAANSVFREEGLGDLLDPVADAHIALCGARRMLRDGYQRAFSTLDEARVDRSYPQLVAAYRVNCAVHSKLYPGAAETLYALRVAGYRIAVCTNKPIDIAEELLRFLGAHSVFDAIVGVNSIPERKPDPTPYRVAVERAGGRVERSLLIGDTKTDFDTARAAGVPIGLVSYAPTGRLALETLEPDFVLDEFRQLPEIVRQFAGCASKS